MPAASTATPTASSQALPISKRRVCIIGGGPAGLMAAEAACGLGAQVDVFDAMPSVGRKFLLAGKGGLNLTHAEPFEAFATRYGSRRAQIEPMLERFGADVLRAWAQDLGVTTFVGSSGRVFPTDLKAAPLLRAWLARLRAAGVRFHMRHRWVGWQRLGDDENVDTNDDTKDDTKDDTNDDTRDDTSSRTGDRTGTGVARLSFYAPAGLVECNADAVVLALGGASWPQLGSDGAWVPLLGAQSVEVAPLQPSNCGFDVGPAWSDHLTSRFAGQPLKNVALRFVAEGGAPFEQAGEFVLTATGIEGSLVYAASAPVREHIATHGHAVVEIDLLPGRDAQFVHDEVARPRGSRSLATHLKSRLGIDGVKAALLHELLPRDVISDAAKLATAIKALPLKLVAPRPVREAISSAGGVRFDGMNDALMLRAWPGVFCCGEMLDWEAPTGGYLLTACIASGQVAGLGAARFACD